MPTNPTKNRTPVLKVLVLPIHTLHVALSLETVEKVMPMPTIFKSGQTVLGLTHVDQQEAIVVDLHQKIFGTPSPQSAKYVVITRDRHQQAYAIPSLSLPSLQDLPLERLQPIPPDYRDRDSLGIASHILPPADGDSAPTLFLLDLNLLFAPVVPAV